MWSLKVAVLLGMFGSIVCVWKTMRGFPIFLREFFSRAWRVSVQEVHRPARLRECERHCAGF